MDSSRETWTMNECHMVTEILPRPTYDLAHGLAGPWSEWRANNCSRYLHLSSEMIPMTKSREN